MLGWAVTFLIIALVAAVFGFGGIAAASAGIAKVLFFLFLVMCVIFFIFGWRGRSAIISDGLDRQLWIAFATGLFAVTCKLCPACREAQVAAIDPEERLR